ncbi:unnamed protein product [Rhizophagus irregularis]|nr:unnamed protein product [Rhizophagus irregularis]
MLENIISEWIKCINYYYMINGNGNYSNYIPCNVDDQLKINMVKFVEANKALIQEQANVSITQSHPQSCYISRKLTAILVQEDSECLDCIIKN